MRSTWEKPHRTEEDFLARRRNRLRRNRKPPHITRGIVVTTVFVFVLQLIIGLPPQTMIEQIQESPFSELFYNLFMLNSLFFSEFYFWQPLTHMFLHAGPLHILFNMVCLFFVGPLLERRVGPAHFLGIYFLGGFLGGILQVMVSGGAGLLGASGGVFSVLLAFCALDPGRRIMLLLFLVIPIPLRCRTLAIGLLGSSAFLFVLSELGIVGMNLGHMAHLGGGLVGWFYVMYLRRLNPAVAPRHRYHAPPVFDPVIEARRISPDAPRPAGGGHPSQAGSTFTRPAAAAASSVATKAGKLSAKDREIERILDKIDQSGFHSLTREERISLDKNTGR